MQIPCSVKISSNVTHEEVTSILLQMVWEKKGATYWNKKNIKFT
jgi:hypothetical protein